MTTTSPWVAPLVVAGATATVITLGMLALHRRRAYVALPPAQYKCRRLKG